MAIFMPTNQKRLTNVSVVRLKKGGKRFEVACYPNKVKSWRDHLETDLDEVLHTQTVFLNVSKGEVAKKEDLEKIFKTTDQSAICKEILKKGELQVTGKERHSNLDALFSDVAKIVSQKCINPASQRAYSVAIIEKAMRACHVKLVPNRSAKQQATEVIAALQESRQLELEVTLLRVQLNVMPGERVSSTAVHRVRGFVRQEAIEVLSDEIEEIRGELMMVFHVEPGALNELEAQIRMETRGRYEMDVNRSAMTKSASGEGEFEAQDKDEEENEKEEANGAGAEPESKSGKSVPDKTDENQDGKSDKKKGKAVEGAEGVDHTKENDPGKKLQDDHEGEVVEKQKRRRRRKDKKGNEPDHESQQGDTKKQEDKDEIVEEYGNKRRKDRRKKRGTEAKGGGPNT